MIIAMVNAKRGTGKTTSTILLGYAIATMEVGSDDGC